MKKVFVLLRLVKKYKSWLWAHVGSNILAAIFTVLAFPSIKPLFDIFFSEDGTLSVSKPESFSLDKTDEFFQFYLQTWITSSAEKSDQLLKICLLIGTVFFFKNVFTYFALFFITPVRNGVIRDLRKQLFTRISSLPMSYFSEEKKGDLIARVSIDVMEVEWSVLSAVEKIIKSPIILIGAIFYMLIISVKLTLIVILILGVTALVIGIIGHRLRKQSTIVQTSLGRLMVILEETLSGMKVIKAFNAEKKQNDRFQKENNHLRRSQTRMFWRRDLASPLSEFLGILAVCILFVFGATMVFNGEIDKANFFVYLLAFYSAIEPAKALSAAYNEVNKGIAALDRINKVKNQKNPIELNSGHRTEINFEEKISLNNCYFNYGENDEWIIDGIDLQIHKGETVALVGESGSGKSTITDLLMRFYDVQKGSITVDGVNIKEYKPEVLRQLFGLVNQQPVLFNTTIAENISFGTNIHDREQIIEAAKLANAHEFIMDLPKGYDNITGDQGQKLSGGQKQRIALARAILANPPILILDEATSALDSQSEMLVQQTLNKILKNRTSIVVAHRLSTVQNADRIVVLSAGRIIESGDHQSLLNMEGEYANFVNLQKMS